MASRLSTAITLALLSSGISTQAQASGFALIEFGGSGMGNAFAGASAVAEDATTVQFNPAGMTLLKGRQATGVLHAILPKAGFSNSGSTLADGTTALSGGEDDGGRNAFVPNFYYVMDVDDKMKFGLGINTPFGLATKYDDNWIGRYHAVESDVKTVNFNPNISYKVDDKLSVGFGVTFQYVDVILSSAVDFGSLLGAPQAVDGFVKFTGDNWAFGWNAGLLYQFSNDTRIGLAYRSEVTQDVSGSSDFTVPLAAAPVLGTGAFVDSGISAEITLPQSVSASAYHDYDNKWAVLADITWTGWSSFEELRIKYDNTLQPDSVTTEDWDDSLRYSIGANYKMDDKLLLRGGIAYDQTPISNAERRTPRVPGDNRTWLSFGAQYVVDKNIVVDFGYSHLFVSKTQINNTFESSQAALAATITGDYDATVDIFSAQATWKF